MDIAIRVEMLVPGAAYFGAPVNQVEWEKDVIWQDARQKPSWADLVALDAAEAAALERAAALEILDATDKGMARAAEDVIAALEARGLFSAADLPEPTRAKLAARAAARAKL